jgi:hypothetical protein
MNNALRYVIQSRKHQKNDHERHKIRRIPSDNVDALKLTKRNASKQRANERINRQTNEQTNEQCLNICNLIEKTSKE